jgi:hypothetical protein
MSQQGKRFNQPSLTQQHYKDKTDINKIMEKVRKKGIMPPAGELMVADFSEIPDLHTMLQKTRKVNDAFMRLPPEVRNNFRNDPERFIKYMSDPEKKDEQIKLGLRLKEPEKVKEEPIEVIITNPEKEAE